MHEVSTVSNDCRHADSGHESNRPGWYTRNVAWKNTNEMLNFEGFIGVKTGTTGDAGACLVANGIQFGRNRIVVILGAQTNEVRYVDAHNLFRYAFMVMTARELNALKAIAGGYDHAARVTLLKGESVGRPSKHHFDRQRPRVLG